MAAVDLATEADPASELGAADRPTSPPAVDEHALSQLDPWMRFGVKAAGVMFCGVIVLAFFLVPYALLTNGWTPGP